MSTSCWDASPTICGEPQRFSSRHEVHCVCRSSITVLSQPETLNRRRCAPALTPKSSSRRLATPLRKGLLAGEGGPLRAGASNEPVRVGIYLKSCHPSPASRAPLARHPLPQGGEGNTGTPSLTLQSRGHVLVLARKLHARGERQRFQQGREILLQIGRGIRFERRGAEMALQLFACRGRHRHRHLELAAEREPEIE